MFKFSVPAKDATILAANAAEYVTCDTASLERLLGSALLAIEVDYRDAEKISDYDSNIGVGPHAPHRAYPILSKGAANRPVRRSWMLD